MESRKSLLSTVKTGLVVSSIFYCIYTLAKYMQVLLHIINAGGDPLRYIQMIYLPLMLSLLPGLIPLGIYFAIRGKGEEDKANAPAEATSVMRITPQPKAPAYLVYISFVLFSFFCYGYKSYIFHLIYPTNIAETFVEPGDITTYLLSNSAPYLILLLASVICLVIFILGNCNKLHLIIASVLFLANGYLHGNLKILYQAGINDYFLAQGGAGILSLVIGLGLLLFAGIAPATGGAGEQAGRLFSQRIASNQLKNFLGFVVVLFSFINLAFLFGGLSTENRDAAIFALANRDAADILGQASYHIFPGYTLLDALRSLALCLLLNGIFLSVYIYFQRSLGYFSAIVAALATLSHIHMESMPFMIRLVIS